MYLYIYIYTYTYIFHCSYLVVQIWIYGDFPEGQGIPSKALALHSQEREPLGAIGSPVSRNFDFGSLETDFNQQKWGLVIFNHDKVKDWPKIFTILGLDML